MPVMKSSIKLGRILGIDVHVHVTFLLLLGFVGVAHGLAGRSLESALTGVLFLAGLFLCVLLHEYGHALAARRYGIGTLDITLLPIGGVARLARMPEKPAQELVVALAGPLVNVIIAAGLLAGLALAGNGDPNGWLVPGRASVVGQLLAANVFLALFNLVPAFPMDGGRVLRSLMAMRMDYTRATRIAARIGQGMAVIFGFVGLFSNPMLLLIALFVWIGAAQEAAAVEMKSTFADVRVEEAMVTDFRTIAPDERIEHAARLLLAGSQQDFPVLKDGHVVGVLTHGQLIAALREHGAGTPVGHVMERQVRTAAADEPLEVALARGSAASTSLLLVLRNGRLAGMLTAENIGEFFMIRQALSGTPPARPPRPPVIHMPRLAPRPIPAHQLSQA